MPEGPEVAPPGKVEPERGTRPLTPGAGMSTGIHRPEDDREPKAPARGVGAAGTRPEENQAGGRRVSG